MVSDDFVGSKNACENKNYLLKNLPKHIDYMRNNFPYPFQPSLIQDPFILAYYN